MHVLRIKFNSLLFVRDCGARSSGKPSECAPQPLFVDMVETVIHDAITP
jgi:hypothetical protein